MNWEAIFWLVAMVIFIAAEAMTVTLVSIWFAVGALIAAVASLLNGPIWLQIVLFLAVSGGLLALLWPMVRKYLNPDLTRTNVDSIIGSEGYITAAVDNVAATGQGKLGGMEWTARSTSGEPIPAGALVKVDRVEGVKVFVTPAKVETKV